MKPIYITADWLPIGSPVHRLLNGLRRHLGGERGYGGPKQSGQWLKVQGKRMEEIVRAVAAVSSVPGIDEPDSVSLTIEAFDAEGRMTSRSDGPTWRELYMRHLGGRCDMWCSWCYDGACRWHAKQKALEAAA